MNDEPSTENKSAFNIALESLRRIHNELEDAKMLVRMGQIEEWFYCCENLKRELKQIINQPQEQTLSQKRISARIKLNKYLTIKKRPAFNENDNNTPTTNNAYSQAYEAITEYEETIRTYCIMYDMMFKFKNNPEHAILEE